MSCGCNMKAVKMDRKFPKWQGLHGSWLLLCGIFAFEGGGSRSVQPCLASCWCLLPTPSTKKLRLNRFYAAWLGSCHCFISAMIRLVRLSLCHNYLRLPDDGDLKCGPRCTGPTSSSTLCHAAHCSITPGWANRKVA